MSEEIKKDEIKKKKNTDTAKKFAIFLALILTGYFLGTARDSFLPALPAVSTASVKNISASDLKRRLENKDFVIMNVHTPYEGEIEQTDMFINFDVMVANTKRLPNDKNAEIVLYCKSGRMSEEAVKTLQAMGYKNVSHLKGGMDAWVRQGYDTLDLSGLPETVLPDAGVQLPIKWGNIGPKLLAAGVIDKQKFEEVMKLSEEQKDILANGSDTPIQIDANNSRFVVNMLWALGLAQKSTVYTEGPMGKEHKESVGNFASTGGWTLSRGDAIDHLGMHEMIPLTDEDHLRVMEIAKNVYRPCCGNHTWFPDCNHGMAALAAIQMMVLEGLDDSEIYRNVLALNTYWFPTSYIPIATNFARKGVAWGDIDARMVLGEAYSSAKGAGEIAKKVGPLPYGSEEGGGSCGA